MVKKKQWGPLPHLWNITIKHIKKKTFDETNKGLNGSLHILYGNAKKTYICTYALSDVQVSLRIRAVSSESSLGAFWIAKGGNYKTCFFPFWKKDVP